MEVNFKSFRVFFNLSKTEFKDLDIREDFSDQIIKYATGIVGYDLAMRIYKSEESVEITERDIEVIKSIYPHMKTLFVFSMEELLKGMTDENKE